MNCEKLQQSQLHLSDFLEWGHFKLIPEISNNLDLPPLYITYCSFALSRLKVSAPSCQCIPLEAFSLQMRTTETDRMALHRACTRTKPHFLRARIVTIQWCWSISEAPKLFAWKCSKELMHRMKKVAYILLNALMKRKYHEKQGLLQILHSLPNMITTEPGKGSFQLLRLPFMIFRVNTGI